MQPFYTIITVTLNDHHNLLSTYHSIKEQSYTDFEWLIIDGNSVDPTKEFLSSLTMSNAQYISENDKGLYDAMNKGIENARGQYMIFLNAGDTFNDKHSLKRINGKINLESPDFLFGDALEVDDKNTRSYYRKGRPIWWKTIGMFTHHQAMVYKKSLIDKYNIRYDLNYKIAADYDFTVSFLKHSSKVSYANFAICDFLQGGISHKSWTLGIIEQDLIRDQNMNLSFLYRKSIYFSQYLLHTVRYNFTPIYNFYRFQS